MFGLTEMMLILFYNLALALQDMMNNILYTESINQ